MIDEPTHRDIQAIVDAVENPNVAITSTPSVRCLPYHCWADHGAADEDLEHWTTQQCRRMG